MYCTRKITLQSWNENLEKEDKQTYFCGITSKMAKHVDKFRKLNIAFNFFAQRKRKLTLKTQMH